MPLRKRRREGSSLIERVCCAGCWSRHLQMQSQVPARKSATTGLLLLYNADEEIVVQRDKVAGPVCSVESKEWAGCGGLKERGLLLSERCP